MTNGLNKNVKRKMTRHFELNEDENIAYENLQKIAKGVVRKEFIALNAYI